MPSLIHPPTSPLSPFPSLTSHHLPRSDAECRTHFGLWALMKAPLILGTALPKLSPSQLAIISNPGVIAVNQDPLGLQARRVLVSPPSNTSLTTGQGTLAVLGLCNASRPTQTWSIFNTSAHQASHSKLYTAPCSAARRLSLQATAQCRWAPQSGERVRRRLFD